MTTQMNQKVLVTGGLGFLGRPMAAELQRRGHEVAVLDSHRPLDRHDGAVVHGSVVDDEVVQKAVRGVDVVYHLAGVLGTTELLETSVEAVDVNVRGTVVLLDACLQEGVEQVFFASKPNVWLNTYSITKIAAEQFCMMYAENHQMDVRSLRWLNAYGPGQKAHPVRKAVPLMILQALHGLSVEVFGRGEQPVDLEYSEDLARVSIDYMGVPFEVCGSGPRDTGLTVRMSVNEAVERIIAAVGKDVPVVHLPMRPGEDEMKHVQPLEGATAADLIGGNGTAEVDWGLEQTIAYYRNLSREMVDEILEFHYGEVPRSRDTSTLTSFAAELLAG